MAKYELNRRAYEHAKVLVKDGRYVSDNWEYSADDSNVLLGEKGKENWSEYARWFLGNDSNEDPQCKAHYGYPFGKGTGLNLKALESIVLESGKAGEKTIYNAALELLAIAESKDKERLEASGDCDIFICSDHPVDIKAALDNGPGSLPRFSMVAYTGGPMMLSGRRKDIDYSKPIIVDLDGMQGINKNRPALKDHDPTKVVGHTEQITASGGVLTASGVVSNPWTAHSQEIIESSKNKFPWQASIGANILLAEWVPAGKSVQVNGRTFTGPLTVARKSVLGEISFVPLGADDSTSAVIASKRGRKGLVMDKFKMWLKAAGFSESDLAGKKAEAILAAWEASNEFDANDADFQAAKSALDVTASSDGGDTKPAQSNSNASGAIAELRAENARINAINSAYESHIQAFSKNAKVLKSLTEARDLAIEKGTSAIEAGKDAELMALRASRGTGMNGDSSDDHKFNINTGGRGMPITGDIIASSIALSAGIDEKYAFMTKDGRQLPDNVKEVAASKEFRGIGLQHLVGYVAAAHGIHLKPGPLSDTDIRRVMSMEARAELLGAGGFDMEADTGYSTVTLLGVTENLMNKMALVGYGDVESVVDDICWQRDTNDFKPYKSYRMSASGRMQQVNDAGEIKSMGVQDESYQNQLKTHGAIITITRQTILNDDMGMLTDQPKLLGREAAMTREEAVFTLVMQLISGAVQYNTSPPGQTASLVNFFSATLGNYLSGAGSALSISAITAAVQKFMEQVDVNGRPIGITPDRILTSPAMAATVKEINKGINIVMANIGTATDGGKRLPDVNLYQNQVKPVISPFLASRGGKGLSGTNDTQWILLPNPSSGLAIAQIGYLRGNRTPLIERGEAPFSTLGMHMRCIYDFGVAPHDYRAGIYNVGQ